jgi:hypothetical protein
LACENFFISITFEISTESFSFHSFQNCQSEKFSFSLKFLKMSFSTPIRNPRRNRQFIMDETEEDISAIETPQESKMSNRSRGNSRTRGNNRSASAKSRNRSKSNESEMDEKAMHQRPATTPQKASSRARPKLQRQNAFDESHGMQSANDLVCICGTSSAMRGSDRTVKNAMQNCEEMACFPQHNMQIQRQDNGCICICPMPQTSSSGRNNQQTEDTMYHSVQDSEDDDDSFDISLDNSVYKASFYDADVSLLDVEDEPNSSTVLGYTYRVNSFR